MRVVYPRDSLFSQQNRLISSVCQSFIRGPAGAFWRETEEVNGCHRVIANAPLARLSFFPGRFCVFPDLFPKPFKLIPVALSVSKVKKRPVSVVSPKGFSGMFDRTKILFCPGGHLARVGDKTIGISTIVAIELFDEVQVRQSSAI